MKFNDGVIIDSEGPFRVIKLKDGYYVVGDGFCIPIENKEEGEQIINELRT